MSKIFRGSLLIFLLPGGALFLLFQQLLNDSFSGPGNIEEIVDSERRIQTLDKRKIRRNYLSAYRSSVLKPGGTFCHG